jgi:hypothetical protein
MTRYTNVSAGTNLQSKAQAGTHTSARARALDTRALPRVRARFPIHFSSIHFSHSIRIAIGAARRELCVDFKM